MKILPVPLIREADAYTIQNEPIADIDLMERAASVCTGWIRQHARRDSVFTFFCGTGNNGGDGLAMARLLHGDGYDIRVFLLEGPGRLSPSCRINYERLTALSLPAGKLTVLPADTSALPFLHPEETVIDALFGNGLGRVVDGLAGRVIRHINDSGAIVISIDLPSGLFCDTSTVAHDTGAVIRADYTLTFSPPKLALFFPENEPFLGRWEPMEIGLSREFIDRADVSDYLIERSDVVSLLKHRPRFSHKGMFGHALLLAGAEGTLGAAVLAARACLRAGAGLLTVRVPGSGVPVLHTAVPEAMVSADPSASVVSGFPDLARFSCIAAGPGLGKSAETAKAIKLLIQEARGPILFDADAINILADNPTWLGFLPPSCLFTPHPGEFARIAGKSGNHFERQRMQREFSAKHRCFVVLKGAFTSVTTPDGRCYFNPTGNPGMATAGSGDVLTGILTGLLSRGYTPEAACLLGVYLHGLAGDLAAQETGLEALTAGDIVQFLGKSFQSLYGEL